MFEETGALHSWRKVRKSCRAFCFSNIRNFALVTKSSITLMKIFDFSSLLVMMAALLEWHLLPAFLEKDIVFWELVAHLWLSLVDHNLRWPPCAVH